MKQSKSAQNISMSNKPISSTALLRNNKDNYLSSDTSGHCTPASTSVTGAYYPQSSDDNLSDPHSSYKTAKYMDTSMYRGRNNPHLISNKYTTERRHSRRKKHNKSNINDSRNAPSAHHGYYHPSYGAYRPAHGDVAITQSFTPPPSYHHDNNNNNTALSHYKYRAAPAHNYLCKRATANISHVPTDSEADIIYTDSYHTYEEDIKVANAEPADDVNPKNKLFSEQGNDGYENEEHKNTNSTTNYMKVCAFVCNLDMENVFEVMEILILFVFIAFIAVWWVDRNQSLLLFSLTLCCAFFGLLAINMRRVQSSLRLHELGSTLNDFRFILFTIGLIAVIIADQLRYASDANITIKYLWMAHSFVFCIAAMLWCTIDFATYMSYVVSTSFHIFILTGTTLEFARVCYQIADVNDVPSNIYQYNGVLYTVYDFKMDAVLLMLMTEISSIVTLVRDRKREWYCFGPTHVYRHRLLEISRRQRGMIHVNSSHNVAQSQANHHNISGYSYQVHASNEDSLLLIWIINLSAVGYMTFFVWDLHSVYKSIPAAVGILALIVLIYRECDFHLVPLIKEQTHFWFVSFALLELWFVTIYSSFYVEGNGNGMWQEIGSYFMDMIVLSMACVLLFATDLLISTVSSYFILRGTLPAMLLFMSMFSAWYQSFCSDLVKDKIKWPISIVIRNTYYILITMSTLSIVKWIKDPIHKYFIFILNRRKRSILNEHRYRNIHDGVSRDPSTTTNQTPIASTGNRSLLHRQYSDTAPTPDVVNYYK